MNGSQTAASYGSTFEGGFGLYWIIESVKNTSLLWIGRWAIRGFRLSGWRLPSMVVGVTTATTENCFFLEVLTTVSTAAVTVATGSSTVAAFAFVAFALVVFVAFVAFVLAGSASGTGGATDATDATDATGATTTAGAGATRDATATAFLRLGTVRASISRIESHFIV
jgi:hypothetical protein